MEALQVALNQLYTSFLLRDFAGKIVPGCLLLFSISVMFLEPSQVLKIVSGRISFVPIILVAGLAWIIVLGLQSLAGLECRCLAELKCDWKPPFNWRLPCLWAYYPSHAGQEMDIQNNVIQPFLRSACPVDRLQYERFVVIKEATGNLFIAALLSIPPWILWLIQSFSSRHLTVLKSSFDRRMIWGNWRANFRTGVACSLAIAIVIGLHLMNQQHVDKQYDLAKGVLDQIKGKTYKCPDVSETKSEKK